MTSIQPGRYRHYKNKEYRVIDVVKHSETLEDLVLYECLHENTTSKLWVRPLSMFTGTVMVDGKEVPRFQFVREA